MAKKGERAAHGPLAILMRGEDYGSRVGENLTTGRDTKCDASTPMAFRGQTFHFFHRPALLRHFAAQKKHRMHNSQMVLSWPKILS